MTVSRLITFADLPLTNNVINQNTAPSSYGNTNFIGNAFIGDLTRLPFATGKSLSGALTLTQPTSGYFIALEDSINFNYISNTSGWNNATNSNVGRTGAAANYTKADSLGQGDTYCYFASGFVNGAKPGATTFLANPAVVLYAGGTNAGQDGVYLNPVEINTNDQGFDVAGINFVGNQNRNNDTGGLGAVWFCLRSQSKGTKPIDAHISVFGKSKIGIDLSELVTNTSGTWTNAAITLLGNDRIYFNATAGSPSPSYASNPGTTYLSYSSANTGLQGVVGGNNAFLFTSTVCNIYGTVSLMNAGSFSANAAVATSLTGVGPVGSNTTVQEWLTIKNPSGTTRYIPCF